MLAVIAAGAFELRDTIADRLWRTSHDAMGKVPRHEFVPIELSLRVANIPFNRLRKATLAPPLSSL